VVIVMATFFFFFFIILIIIKGIIKLMLALHFDDAHHEK